jgi:hypothetical protein
MNPDRSARSARTGDAGLQPVAFRDGIIAFDVGLVHLLAVRAVGIDVDVVAEGPQGKSSAALNGDAVEVRLASVVELKGIDRVRLSRSSYL